VFVWFIMAIALVVIVVGGFTGRRYQNRHRSGSDASATSHTTHHGKKARNHRGRGRGH
jgi:hypothetical protein